MLRLRGGKLLGHPADSAIDHALVNPMIDHGVRKHRERRPRRIAVPAQHQLDSRPQSRGLKVASNDEKAKLR